MADRALYPEIDELRRRDGLSVNSAALKLALAGKVVGKGTAESRAKRLASLYYEDHS
jgi:hypothetical protein